MPAFAEMFGNQTFISPTGQSPVSVATAVDGDGHVVWVWEDSASGRIAMRRRIDSNGSMSPPEFISAPGIRATGPVVAMHSGGEAVIAWLVPDGGLTHRLLARTLSHSGVLGPARTAAGGSGLRNYQIVVGGDTSRGTRFAIVYQREDSAIMVRDLNFPELGNLFLVVAPGADKILQPQAEMALNNVLQVLWLQETSAGAKRIMARARLPDRAAFTPIRVVAGSNPPPLGFDMSIDATGDALASWYSHDNLAPAQIRPRSHSAAGVLGPVRTLHTEMSDTVPSPVVASDANGNSVVMWNRNGGGVLARSVSATAVLGPVRTLASRGTGSVASDAAALPDGSTVLVWRDSLRRLVRTSTRLADGTYTVGRTVSAHPTSQATLPDIAVGDGGDAVITWIRWAGGGVEPTPGVEGSDDFRVQAAFGYPEG